MSKKSPLPKRLNLTDTVFVVGFMAWSCYLIGKCRFEGFAEGIGIPRAMIGMNKEAFMELGATELMLYVLLVPGSYFLCKAIFSSLMELGGKHVTRLASRIRGWGVDTQLMCKSMLAFGIGFLLLNFGTSHFIDGGKEHAKKYLMNPTIVRYVEKSAPTEKHKAVLLYRHSGRYFLKPQNMGKNTSFIIFEEGTLLKLEVIQ